MRTLIRSLPTIFFITIYLSHQELYFLLKYPIRDYSKIVDSRTMYKNKLNSELSFMFPGLKKIFSNTTGTSSIAIFKSYQIPTNIINADKKEVIATLKKASKKNIWCYETYEKFIRIT